VPMYELRMPIAVDRLLVSLVPSLEWARGRYGVPSGIRTRVADVKGRRPGPLDDGDSETRINQRIVR
jgi:hypothetical protein